MTAPSGRPSPALLGLALGAAVIGLTIILIALFSRHGLPKDPKEWQRLQQQRSASESP